jgi:peptidoglycan/xylan/chitin deacetylase (PgdA/CDA1 family)/SAM-dependent methyltransferase
VSVIVPARDALSTLANTIASLAAQTLPGWEAVVIDDGSTDGTAEAAERLAAADPRVRVLRQAPAGVSAARNHGVRAARGELVLFLDADDGLEATALQELNGAFGPEVDAVICGWTRVGEDGAVLEEHPPPGREALVRAAARGCPFAVHACLIRREVVLGLSGFEEGRRTCEDWDLWQRLVRSRARLAVIPRALARYRLRRDSASVNGVQLLADAREVIARGHRPDPRIAEPHERFGAGRPPAEEREALVSFLSWCAALEIGRGEDPAARIPVPEEPLGIDPDDVVAYLLVGVAMARGAVPASWPGFFDEVVHHVEAWPARLEAATRTPRLAHRVRRRLERAVAGFAVPPARIGRTLHVALDAEAPFTDVVADDADALVVSVSFAGPLGRLEVPVVGDRVPKEVLRDAAAARFGWEVLGRHFGATVYRELEPASDGIRRGGALVKPGPVPDGDAFFHDHVGWTVLLQEVLGQPTWDDERFYRAAGRQTRFRGRSRPLELSRPPRLLGSAGGRARAIRLGGVAIGALTIPEGGMGPQELRAAALMATDLELMRVAVREFVLGRPAGAPALGERIRKGPGAAPSAAAWRLGRRQPHSIGGSASRWAALPGRIGDALTRREGEAAVVGRVSQVEPGLYDPTEMRDAAPVAPATSTGAPTTAAPTLAGRADFDALFTRGADPWGYESDYERVKYDQTLALLPKGTIRRALEVGCAEGHFTARLAERCGELLAVDISEFALERAAARCAEAGNVQFAQFDLFADGPLPGGGFDLIVCSEVLYYAGDADRLGGILERLVGGLAEDGVLVTAHANVLVDDPSGPGFDWAVPFGAVRIGKALRGLGSVGIEREIRTPAYRIHRARSGFAGACDVEEGAAGEMLPDVAADFRPDGGTGAAGSPWRGPQTEAIPILMYHQIAAHEGDPGDRWRVPPELFARQMRYLRDAGYESATLEEWEEARRAKRPLPGRRFLLTFDDGFADFATAAWPLLRELGFDAHLFVVSGRAGGVSDWDAAFWRPAPLLDAPALRDLHRDGVRLGAHTVDHEPLTGLPPDAVMSQALDSALWIEALTGAPCRSIAYPYGDHDPLIQQAAGAVGFDHALTTRSALATFSDDRLALPRIEVDGRGDLAQFVLSLSPLV